MNRAFLLAYCSAPNTKEAFWVEDVSAGDWVAAQSAWVKVLVVVRSDYLEDSFNANRSLSSNSISSWKIIDGTRFYVLVVFMQGKKWE